MTVREALDAVGTLKPHAYGAEALLRELSRLDGRIMKELWQGRAGAAEELPNYTEANAANTALVRLERGMTLPNQYCAPSCSVAATMFLLAFFHGPLARYWQR